MCCHFNYVIILDDILDGIVQPPMIKRILSFYCNFPFLCLFLNHFEAPETASQMSSAVSCHLWSCRRDKNERKSALLHHWTIHLLSAESRKDENECSPEKAFGTTKVSHAKTLLSVRMKTTGERRLSFVSLAAYDRGYPPFLTQQ